MNAAKPNTEHALDATAKALRPIRRGTILIIDDDPLVRKAVQRTLAREHDVVALATAEEALERVTSGERFDVIVCDLMMPAMTGMDLHEALLASAPELAERMVFLTGGAYSTRAASFLAKVSNARIEKPFDTAYFRALLRERIS